MAFLSAYDANFPRVRAFMNEVMAKGQQRMSEEGEPYIITWGGRRLPCNPDKIYVLVNYLIQGSARDLFGKKMLEMDAAGLGEFMVVPVHDEIIMDVPDDDVEEVIQTVHEVMPENGSFAVEMGVDVETAQRWGDKYE